MSDIAPPGRAVRVSCVLIAAALAGPARGQEFDKVAATAGPMLQACGPDARIAFRFGQVSLHIAPRWLAARSLTILDLAKTPAGLGRPYLSLLVDKASGPTTDQGSRLLPADAPLMRKAAAPYVEDVTELAARMSPPKSAAALSYRVVYPGVAGGFASSIVVTCGGEPRTTVGRQCFTPLPYRFRDDLTVTYTFQQDRLPLPGAPQPSGAGAMAEPDGVLAFDRAIRTWIDGLRKP
jgi:hypothetical protein